MTSQTFFFTNNRLTLIYTGLGFLFLFASAFWAKQIELVWMGIGASVFFFVLALFFNMKEFNKEHEQITKL